MDVITLLMMLLMIMDDINNINPSAPHFSKNNNALAEPSFVTNDSHDKICNLIQNPYAGPMHNPDPKDCSYIFSSHSATYQ